MIDAESPFAGLGLREPEPARGDFPDELLVVRRIQLVTRQPVLRSRTLTRGPIHEQLLRILSRVGL